MQLGKVLDIALKVIFLTLVMFNIVPGADEMIKEVYIEWSLLVGLLVDAVLLAWITATQKDSLARIPDGMVAAKQEDVKNNSVVFVPPATPGPTGEAIKTSEGLVSPKGP
jgi:hypothetical protein